MRTIDLNGLSTAFLVDKENKLFAIITDGDIRSAILHGEKLDTPAMKIANKTPVTINEKENSKEGIKNFLRDSKVSEKIPKNSSLKVPVLDDDRKVIDLLFIYSGEKIPTITKKHNKKENIKKVLVVGGAGYLGSCVCKKLLERGYSVKVLDNLMFGDHGIKKVYGNENFEFLNGDVRNISTIVDAIKDVQAVIDLAAIVGDPACAHNPKKTIEINNFSTKVLADICKYSQINRFIFASTCSVYGASTDERLLNEDSELNPVSLYADMKLATEKILMDISDENFSPTIFRMPTLFGASDRMRFDLVINRLTAQAANKENITVFGGDQWRPFIHVEDAAEFYVKALELPIETIGNKILNVGSSVMNYKIIEIANIIKKITSANIDINQAAIDKRNYKVDFSLSERLFGIKPRFDIEKGVKQMLNIDKKVIADYKSELYNNVDMQKKESPE